MGVGYLTGQGGGGSNVKSVQRGSILMDATTKNITISSVDLQKSVVIVNTVSAESTIDKILVSGSITSATNLRLTIGAISTTTYVYWQVIEFNNVKTLQTGTTTLTSATTTVNISNVNMTKSIIFSSFKSTNAQTASLGNQTAYIDSTTTIVLKDANYITGKSAIWYVIEFK